MWPSGVMFFGGDLDGKVRMRELCEGLVSELDRPCSYCNLFTNQLQS